jgi:hypothetical protein
MMFRRSWRAEGIAWACLVSACGPVGSPAGTSGAEPDETTRGEATTASMPGTRPPTSGTTSTPVTTGDTSFDDGGTTTASGEGTRDIGFISVVDTPGSVECSPWEEDCPSGEKCMPWANDGGAWWNATKCVPIAVQPDGVGEPCTVEGSGVSGIDSCDIHSMCWYVESDTLEGTCVAFCSGSEVNPSCQDGCSSCSISSEGTLNLCLPQCDPIGQDCGEGQACYLVEFDILCVPDASGDQGGAGDPCQFLNSCDPGLQSAAAMSVPGCEGLGCCTPFCAVESPTACDALPGTVCTPLGLTDPGCFGEGAGLCLLP